MSTTNVGSHARCAWPRHLPGTVKDKRVTYHGEVLHDAFSRLEHAAHVFALFHESYSLTPGHVPEEIPGEEGNSLGNVAWWAALLGGHVPTLEFSTEDTDIVIHKRLELQRVLHVVELVHGLLAARIELVAAGAEDVLENVAIGECVVDGIEVALGGLEHVSTVVERRGD